MKKQLLLGTFLISILSFGQISLEHSFPNEQLTAYTTANETYYITFGSGEYNNLTSVKIYNNDFSLRSEFFPTIPDGYFMKIMTPNFNRNSCIISKGIFDLDDKLDIVVFFEKDYGRNLVRVYNEDGEIVKDFGLNNYYKNMDFDPTDFYVFHDKASGKNKLRILKTDESLTNFTTEIYTLPSIELNLKEAIEGSQFEIYPNPAQTALTVSNPKNGINQVEIYNINGQLIKKNSFDKNIDKVSIDVRDLEKGVFFLKIGNLSSKFIKR